MKFRFFTLLMALAVLSAAMMPQEKVHPLEARRQVQQKTMEAFRQRMDAGNVENPSTLMDSIRMKLSVEILPRVEKENSDDQQRLELGRLYADAGQTDTALEMFAELDRGNSETARGASISRMNVLIGRKDYTTVAEQLAEHWNRFDIRPDDQFGVVHVVRSLCTYYAQNSQHEKVAELAFSALDRTPQNLQVPYSMPELLQQFADSFVIAGKGEEAQRRATALRASYLAEYDKQSTKFEQAGTEPDRQQKYFLQRYRRIADSLGNALSIIALINRPAPTIHFSEVLNRDASLTFDDFQGKVVLIDFWANWCGPCKAAFPHLQELYQAYADQGLVILGVTGLQGTFNDGALHFSDLEPDREISLTKDFIERHAMTWPVVMSKHGAYDSRFGVVALPTMVFVDRRGAIRYIDIGFRAEKTDSMRKRIEELLSEPY